VCTCRGRRESDDRAIGWSGDLKTPIGIVVEEAEETAFWLDCLIEAGIVKQELLVDLLAEANELVAIFAASYRTARR
jgi:hypothetical protein